MTTVILFVFGAVVGSFLNVLGLRLHSGLSLGGRSSCAICRHQLSWYELIPVLSYLFLRGRCSSCHSKISPQYFIVEFLTGLLFASLYWVYNLTPYFLLITSVFCLYFTIVIYDIRHQIIPDALVYLSILLSLASYFLLPTSILDLLAGPILFSFFASVWFLSRGRAMGFGDAKLALSIGLLLGAANGFSAVMLAFWIGAVYGLGLMAMTRLYPLLSGGKKITMKSELPFAPFLVLGAWMSVIFNLDLLHVSFF